jgi:hypothetical protein
MIENNQQEFSDEAVRRFLLGSLRPAEQSRFEHSLFVDEALEERVRLAELELSDDYAANRLNRAERDLFRQRFLLTADREKKLEVSRALQRNFAGTVSIEGAGWWQGFAGIFDIRRHAWKYAFATLALILLFLATALLVRKEQSRFVFTPPRPGPKPSATTTPRMTNHSTNAPGPSHNETSPELPLHEGLTTSVVLTAGTPLESAPAISANGEIITVQLMLVEPISESYEVSVMTMAGESVFSANELKRTEDKTLGFDLPASAIRAGDFQVALTRIDGESKQSARTYYFRVR